MIADAPAVDLSALADEQATDAMGRGAATSSCSARAVKSGAAARAWVMPHPIDTPMVMEEEPSMLALSIRGQDSVSNQQSQLEGVQTVQRMVDHRQSEQQLDALGPSSGLEADQLFPNSFHVTGVKHICDNLLGSILLSLPQLLGCMFSCCHDTHEESHDDADATMCIVSTAQN